MKLLIKFRHGLGDAVQLLFLVRQLRERHPDWHIAVALGRGKDSLFHGTANEVLIIDQVAIDETNYDRVEDLSWPENRHVFVSAPCTKASRCLSEVFGLAPSPADQIGIQPSATVLARVQRFIDDELDGRPFGLLHYQGNTAQSMKDIGHDRARMIQKQLAAIGLVPVLLDWDCRSPLIGEGMICPNRDHPLWTGHGTGDGATLAALIGKASLMVGIDSGPGHVAALTNTETIQWWHGFHPIFYAHPAPNIKHLVHQKVHEELPPAARDFFERNYRFQQHDGKEETVVAAIAEFGGSPRQMQSDGQLIFINGMWVRQEYAPMDLVTVGSVYGGDEYRTALRGPQIGPQTVVDVGANIGAFAMLWHRLNPEANIICVEADARNLSALRANVGDFAKIVHAACTYETGPLRLLTSVFPGTGNTGATTVAPESEADERPGCGACRLDPESIRSVTLEELVDGPIDVLKLDCEGAEFSILGKSPSLDQIGFIFGEWHNAKKWSELLSARFAGWDYGVMADHGDIGIFHLRHPRFPASGVLRWNSQPDIPVRPRKVIFRNWLSPGDIITLTAAVRDLHLSHPGRFVTDVRTPCAALWKNNPYITPLNEKDDGVDTIQCEYPLINQSNSRPYHMIHGFRLFLQEKLAVPIEPHAFKGDIHLSAQEKGWMSQVEEIAGIGARFWIIVSGGKNDYTAKWWDPDRAQQVVDHFAGRIRFVQCGEGGHHHPRLRHVIDLVGHTDLRQMVRLMHHADGVICPVTMFMHLAAAVEVRPGRPKNRPCVVIAGGREPAHWEAYPHHQFLHTMGALPCCDDGGCWKSRVEALGDGDGKDNSLCLRPVTLPSGRKLPQCLDMITADDVIRAVESYLAFESRGPLTRGTNGHSTALSPRNGTAPCRADHFEIQSNNKHLTDNAMDQPVARQTVEELAAILHDAKQRSTIPAAQFDSLHARFIAHDQGGAQWSVGVLTRRWHCARQGRWERVQSPPATLYLDQEVICQIEALKAVPPPIPPPAKEPATNPINLACSCGATLVPGQKFCRACGKPAAAVSVPAKRPAFCTACGAGLSGQGKYCPKCGKALPVEDLGIA